MRIFRTLQHLCLTELKINRYEYDNYVYADNFSGSFWSGFYYQIEGEMEFKTDYFTLHVKPGDFFYIPENFRFDQYSSSDAPVKYYVLHFSFRASEDNLFDDKYGFTHITQFDPQIIAARFESILEKCVSGDAERLSAVGEFYQLFADTLPYLDPAQPYMIHPALQAAIDYTTAHLIENFSVADLAKHCMVSESTVYHLFQKHFHSTPISYRNSRRVKASFILLTTTDLSIEEIAARFNFGSTANYRKAFRKVTGSTPKRYRMRFRECH